MNKKVKVIVIDPYTLKLQEDAKKGDIIDLNDINEVDNTILIEKINEGKDYEYNKRLLKEKENLKQKLQLQNSEKIKEYEVEITKLKEKSENEKKVLNLNLKNQYEKEIVEYENKIKDLKNEFELKEKQKLEKLNIKIAKLEKDIETKEEILKLKLEKEYQSKIDQYENKLNHIKEVQQLKETNIKNEVKDHYLKQMKELEERINYLEKTKSSFNVKEIGENLEKWCDAEMQTHLLHSSENIEWYKDNEVVRGTKADYIYKVYATGEKKEEDLLTSVILEMKSEDPTSKTKQTNAQFYKKLHEDRVKKNIEYAILVSELEWDPLHDIPIKKVNEYEKMFVVRPAYFIILLNIITAFGLKYKEILTKDNKERLEFKDLEEIIEEFEEMKSDILDKSIRYIESHIETINQQSENIEKANKKIQESSRIILDTHLNTIINKINNFNIKRITRKIDKL